MRPSPGTVQDCGYIGGMRGLACLPGMAEAERYAAVVDRYPFRVSEYYMSLVQWQDADDPVRRQCVPDVRELEGERDGSADPFAEAASTPVPGLVQRYGNRVVLLATRECAVRCRHCTRKNILGEELAPTRGRFEDAIRYIAGRPLVREVIVSGGDPLLVAPELLDWLLGSLQRIAHVEVLRVGTRLPVVDPDRVDAIMCEMLARHRPLWVNTQFNHVREVTDSSMAACARLLRLGIPVSNQTVILRGVNDSAPVLMELCNTLQRNMIRPYYAFLCDPVQGTSHFWVDRRRAVRIARTLQASLGGLSMPKFVVDEPGAKAKVPLL